MISKIQDVVVRDTDDRNQYTDHRNESDRRGSSD